jgi:hypothetical protein
MGMGKERGELCTKPCKILSFRVCVILDQVAKESKDSLLGMIPVAERRNCFEGLKLTVLHYCIEWAS